MAVARMYPDLDERGRGKKSPVRDVFPFVPKQSISKARAVLAHSPALAAEVRLLAERRAGGMLKTMKQTGERDPGGRGRIESRAVIQLKDLKIEPMESHRWQMLARLEESELAG